MEKRDSLYQRYKYVQQRQNHEKENERTLQKD